MAPVQYRLPIRASISVNSFIRRATEITFALVARFDSLKCSLDQLADRLILDQEVLGSTPGRAAKGRQDS